jgi:CheY-like chemotaxis protein
MLSRMDLPDRRNATILVAEDEETDAMILQRAFHDAHLPYPLTIVPDGSHVLNYLEGAAPYANRMQCPLPSLMLLDLKMPRMNGFDVLAWLAEKPQYKEIPVIVFSSSGHASDIEKALSLGARDYQIKPLHFETLVTMVKTITDRWLKASN